jgi:virginiamycin B lyase
MNHRIAILLLLAVFSGGCSSAGTPESDDRLPLTTTEGTSPPATVTNVTGPLGGSVPRAIVAAADGVWFTDSQHMTLSHLATDGALVRFPVPFASEWVFDAAVGADETVWFNSVTADLVAHVGRMTVDGEVTLFDVPSGARVRRLTACADAAVWFTAGESVGRVDAHGAITETAVGSVTGDLACDAVGTVWFTEPEQNRIGRLDTAGTLTHVEVPTAASGLEAIVLGAEGHLWFSESNAGKIGRIDPAGTITEFDVVTPPARVRELTAGPGGIWFTVQPDGYGPGRVGRVSTAGDVAILELPPVSDPLDLDPPRDVHALPHGIASRGDELWLTTQLRPFDTGVVLRVDFSDGVR